MKNEFLDKLQTIMTSVLEVLEKGINIAQHEFGALLKEIIWLHVVNSLGVFALRAIATALVFYFWLQVPADSMQTWVYEMIKIGVLVIGGYYSAKPLHTVVYALVAKRLFLINYVKEFLNDEK